VPITRKAYVVFARIGFNCRTSEGSGADLHSTIGITEGKPETSTYEMRVIRPCGTLPLRSAVEKATCRRVIWDPADANPGWPRKGPRSNVEPIGVVATAGKNRSQVVRHTFIPVFFSSRLQRETIINNDNRRGGPLPIAKLETE